MTKKRKIFSFLLAIVMCFSIFGSATAMATEPEADDVPITAITKEKIAESEAMLKAIVQPRDTQVGQTLTGTLSPQVVYTGTLVVDKDCSNATVYYSTRITAGSGTATYKLTVKKSNPTVTRSGNISANGKPDFITIGNLPKGIYTVEIKRIDGSTDAYFAFAMEFYQ